MLLCSTRTQGRAIPENAAALEQSGALFSIYRALIQKWNPDPRKRDEVEVFLCIGYQPIEYRSCLSTQILPDS
jgi:hypothetical protein